jgi:hypothetical protein
MLFTNHLRRAQSGRPLFLLSCVVENVAPDGLGAYSFGVTGHAK